PPPPLFPYTTLFRSLAATVELGEEFRGPLVMVFPDLVEQFPGKAGRGLNGFRIFRQHHSVIGQGRPLQISVLGDDSLVMHKSPQDRKSTRLNSSHVA